MAGIKLPASYGGLMRYFEDSESKIKLRPDQVIALAFVFIVIVLLLHMLA
ncbi:MAG TPA: preprotein translocase subunit Sec61beta [Candidatus Aenigmarchaeota archaeon]|nr:MAG: preprotein translocase subunit Sec61beta [Nanoarchaeota archaeon]HDO79864.1 preprotein translocase subunit Sec61beta [Candidatus Aenigmarchaeota archaeon]HEX32916.1 preprotein translocase subunit Sec61beta [Candidatus Aenigmarchaeota archaeon]